MHLIFDLDGTLIDSLPGLADTLNAALSEEKLPTHSITKIRSFIGDGSRVLCQRAAPDQPDSVIDSIFNCFMQKYSELWKDGTSIYSGILEMLEAIQAPPGQHHLSVLSNKPHSFTVEIIESIFPDTFQTVLGQREGISKKPDPKGILEILETSNHEDKTAYLIGDSDVDILTAKNANIGSIAVTWGLNDLDALKAVNPDHIISSTAELNTLLASLSA